MFGWRRWPYARSILFKVIVILTHEPSNFQAYLRYRRLGANRWKFAGAFSPFVKYFAPEHRIVRLVREAVSRYQRTSNAGSGLSSKVEQWIDLTLDDFQPVFRPRKRATTLRSPMGSSGPFEDLLCLSTVTRQIKLRSGT